MEHQFDGLRSGEYSGKYRSSAPRASIATSTPVTLGKETLSATTMSLRRRAGTRHCSIYKRGMLLHSAINVSVSQCPIGTSSIRRSRAGSNVGTDHVGHDAVSSINTRRAGSFFSYAVTSEKSGERAAASSHSPSQERGLLRPKGEMRRRPC